MSANNQVVILKNKKEEFEVHENLCVDNKFKPTNETLLTKEACLEDALRFANKYCLEEMVEYGTYVSPTCYAIDKTAIWKKIHKWFEELGYEIVSTSHHGDGSESIRFKKCSKEGSGKR